jgi:hypothetical protein
MTQYKRNHTIPRAMIEFWVDPTTPHKGVHVYEIEGERTTISTGRGSSPFSFATENDLHVPLVDGERAVELEKWFSTLEGALLPFIRQAHQKKVPIEFGSEAQQTKTMMALLGLEIRSPYNLRMVQAELERNDVVRQLIASGQGASVKQQALENLIHAVTEQVAYISPVELNIFHPPPGRSWILSDRPFLPRAPDPKSLRTVVLSNRVLLSFRRSECGDSRSEYLDASDDMVDMINNEIALSARQWIVADSPTTLARYAEVVRGDEWRRRMAEDTISFLPIKFLTTGWAITR